MFDPGRLQDRVTLADGVAALALALILGGGWWVGGQQAAAAGRANWIWFNEGDPAKEAPKGTIYFRKAFKINQLLDMVEDGSLDITADNEFIVWVNGTKLGEGKEWKRVQTFDVKKHLVNGDNVIAVAATNTDGPAGLLVRLGYVPNGQNPEISELSNNKYADPQLRQSVHQPIQVYGGYLNRVIVV